MKIKPFEEKYAEQCAELQQHLWTGTKEERIIRFEWAYTNCPNNVNPLVIIAVNENDEVMGFRGYFLNKFVINNKELLIAQISDTVVSPKARRMGIFQKMTNFSLDYLKSHNIPFIINLGPSWPPYYGYKKLGFEDLSQFNTSVYFSPLRMIKQRLIKTARSNDKNNKDTVSINKNNRYFITQRLTDDIINQVEKLNNSEKIKSSKKLDNLKWRTQRPGKNYIYCYSLDDSDCLISFVMISTSNFYNYDYGVVLSQDTKDLKRLIKIFRKQYKPSMETAWNFALDKTQQKQLRAMKFTKIPFLNKFRNNPPAMVYTLQKKENGELDWIINGTDIRDIRNWSLTKLDKDSF